MTWLTVISSVCSNHNPVRYSFMTYHRVCNHSNMTGATCRTGTDYTSVARFLNEIQVDLSLVFCVMFCRLVFVLCLLVIVLSVLRLPASNYPFGIFKLFFTIAVQMVEKSSILMTLYEMDFLLYVTEQMFRICQYLQLNHTSPAIASVTVTLKSKFNRW